MSRFRRILHPTDFSRASTAAFNRAITMAKKDRSELVLVHVLAPPMPLAGEGYIPPNVYEDLETSARKYAEKRLNALQDKARGAGVQPRTLIREGPAAQHIARADT